MQIVAFAGLAQCGKTTLANEVSRIAYESNLVPVKVSFAGALKRAASYIGADKETQPELYRKFCQQVGGFMRDPNYVPGVTGPDYWVTLTKNMLRQLMQKDNAEKAVYIFDDVRFLNEVEMLKSLDATMVYVDRETELPDPAAAFRTDISEKMAYDIKADGDLRQRYFDFVVSSTGSADEFLARIRPFIPVWLGLAAL